MLKHLFSLACLLVAIQFSFAQLNRCASDQMSSQMYANDPGYQMRLEALEARIRQYEQFVPPGKTQTVAYIPVVFHVVYNTAQQNITDAQIQSQIDILNADFRRMNADTSNTRNIFKGVAGDAKIQFCLATRDPNGLPTNGITRTSTSVSVFNLTDEVKFDSLGGKNAWPADQYLNIWVCRLSSAVGYAYYPGVAPQYDGVVLHYAAVGDTGYVLPPYHLGRTATHEVGHWLGLYHTFENGCDGNTSSSCASMGDKVCDTPSDSTQSFGCDTTQNACIDFPVDLPDQVENYMDYADDICTNMFSQGQCDRMNGFLYTARLSLLSSNGCAPTSGTYLDASAIRLTEPLLGGCDTLVTPVLEIGNQGNTAITSLDITYDVDGGSPSLYNWSGTLASGASTQITLPVISSGGYGMHNIHIILSNPNTSADNNPVNNETDLDFTVYDPNNAGFVMLNEGFENGVLPLNWLIENPDGDTEWELAGTCGGFSTSANSIYFDNFYVGWDGIGRFDGLLTPKADFSGQIGAELRFDVAYMDPDHWFYTDTLIVSYTLDCGDTWIELWRDGGTSLSTAPKDSVFQPWIPDANEWKQVIINLQPVLNQPNVGFKFENKSGWGNNLYLDNIMLDYVVADDDILNQSAVEVYPNPAKAQFYVDGLDGGSELSLFNVMGQSVDFRSDAGPDGSVVITPAAAAGQLLFLRIRSSSGSVTVKKILMDQ